ncbi:MAG: hypothetical protein GC159_15265 [Phycisphaera sp.]|nr:hypothetical protein [Phycisphaera sp.]
MRTNLANRDVRFYIEDGCLVRTVVGDHADGRSYTHRCTKAVFETVAHAISETPASGEGTTLTLIARQENLPYTQVNVALEFLKERSVVDVRHRRCYPATKDVYLDAMVEFHALAHGGEEPRVD